MLVDILSVFMTLQCFIVIFIMSLAIYLDFLFPERHKLSLLYFQKLIERSGDIANMTLLFVVLQD